MMQQHPLSKLFPPMPPEDFRELVEDIRRQGVLEPIELLDGMVLDGWNRYSACQEIGIPCPTRPWSPPNGNSDAAAFQHVWARNVLRRHLTAAQRIQIIADRHPEVWKEVGNQQDSGRPKSHNPDGKLATAHIASEAGVSEESVRMAKRIEKADQKLWERATSGELSLKTADALRIGQKVDTAKEEKKTRQVKKEMEWNTHFVKEVIEKINAIEKIQTDIRKGLAHEKFAPEAKPFIARRLEKAMTWLTTAQEELTR